MTNTELKTRTPAQIVPSLRTTEGGGVPIRRSFPTARLDDVDPFLLFDHLGPLEFKPGQNLGFPDHPHRGFETVTYLLEGLFEHRDSFGHRGLLEPGDVQWMTAGSGLVHSEMPGTELVRNGGILHGFQIWVNLPRVDKMKPPHYQELKAAAIPKVENADGTVKARVIAGTALGQKGAVETHTPILYVHYTLAPGASVVQEIPRKQNAVAYVINGTASFEGAVEQAAEGRLAIFAHDGEQIRVTNTGTGPLDLLVLAGEPLGEPVARYGPFVMNTKEELYQAVEDFRNGKMGQIE
jgi:quercetin 2,3-dioxygenase